MSDLPDARRVIGTLIQVGTVESVDRAEATCRVRIGDTLTGDIPWLTARAGTTRIWCPPSVGEQVVLLCPEGDTDGGIALPALFSDACPAPSSNDELLAAFEDGAAIGYDPQAHRLTAELPEGATVTIIARGGLHFTGDLTVDGDISSTGTVTGDTDVVGGGKSLKGHKHLGVTAGSAISGIPQ